MASTLSSLATDIAGLVAGAAPRLVSVRGNDGSFASGLVWRTGLVVSAHEALGGEEEFAVGFDDGASRPGEVVGRDPTTDVALIRVETAEFGDWRQSPTPRPGALTVVVGRGDYSATAVLATVSEIGPAWRSMRGGEIDARITLGVRLSSSSEGGAVLTPEGELVGMAVTGPRRHALTIPASTIARSVGTLSDKGYVPRGYLGVTLHQLGDSGGAIVVGLEGGGPAQQAGLLVGDIITTWNGEPVSSVADVSNRLSTDSVGRTINLGVLRGGSPSHIDVSIGERPRA